MSYYGQKAGPAEGYGPVGPRPHHFLFGGNRAKHIVGPTHFLGEKGPVSPGLIGPTQFLTASACPAHQTSEQESIRTLCSDGMESFDGQGQTLKPRSHANTLTYSKKRILCSRERGQDVVPTKHSEKVAQS